MLLLASLLALPPTAHADVVTEWNVRAADLVGAAGLVNQQAHRVLAITHTAAFEAANAITRRYPASLASSAPAVAPAPNDASVDAAIAAAHRGVLSSLVPGQQAAIDRAYQAALGAIADGLAKDAGRVVGERTAHAVLARRADDGAAAPESYRPFTTSGRYVPTAIPAVPQWPRRAPWLLSEAAAFRPGAPPALDSEGWTRAYNEVKTLGGARSALRTAEQTTIARFWEATHPAIYHGVVRSIAELPGRDVMRNARLFAAVTQAIDDAMIALFDAKYHYAFWRPITAIRNGDLDGNDATERDPSWLPLLATPMHPEYPCAHCIQAGVVASFWQHEIGAGPQPVVTTTSPSAGGARRSWASPDAFVQEVGDARIYGGMHYRFSTDAGIDMGRRIGMLAARHFAGEGAALAQRPGTF